MEIRTIQMIVEDAVNRGRISRRKAEDVLLRVEHAEEEQTKVENASSVTDEEKERVLKELNAASAEVADLLNKA